MQEECLRAVENIINRGMCMVDCNVRLVCTLFEVYVCC